MTFEKVILEGEHVRLEPINQKHKLGLIAAINDGKLWELFVTHVPHPNDIDAFIADAKHCQQSGDGLAFVTIDKRSGNIVGSSRFFRTSLADKRTEIGFTFLAKSSQRSPINTEAKLLMLTHAFEQLNFNRVEFLTDHLNTASRNAILRLGAKEEGILRSHKVMPNGRVRDSVIFSIIHHEWVGVKQQLNFKLSNNDTLR